MPLFDQPAASLFALYNTDGSPRKPGQGLDGWGTLVEYYLALYLSLSGGQIGNGLDPVKAWRGYADLSAWTFTSFTASNSDGYLRLTSTVTDPRAEVSGLSFSGATARYFAIRFRVVSGTQDKSIYWSTGSHAFSESYKASLPTALGDSQWQTAVVDMWSPTSGGSDWKSSTITGLRLDMVTDASAVVDIAWVAVAGDAVSRGNAENDARYVTLKNLPVNVLTLGADNTGATSSSTAFQAAYDAATEGDVIVVPGGVYNLASGVAADGSNKSVVWDIYGTLNISYNWSDVLPGTIHIYGERDLLNSVPYNVIQRTVAKGMGLNPAKNIDYYSIDIVDDVKAFPGRVQGLAIYSRMKDGATGIRQVLTGQVHVEAATANTLGSDGQHYVGVQGGAFAYSADGGTNPASASTSGGALFGMSSFAELKSGATSWKNITGCEFNTVTNSGSSVWYRSGIQIAGGGQVRGSVHDYGISVSMLDYASGLSWKTGIHFGNENGAMPLGTDSTVMKLDLNTILNVFDFGTTPVTGSYMKGQNIDIKPAEAQFTAPDHVIRLGNFSAANTPSQRWYSSGNGVGTPDVTIAVSGGTTTLNRGTYAVSAAEVAVGCVVRPSTDNAYTLGAASFRWSAIWCATATISTSDERQKENIADIDPAVARKLLLAIKPITFTWKDDDVPAAFETRSGQRQKVLKVFKEEPVESIEIVDGKAVLRISMQSVEYDEPQFDEYPMVDENGEPVMRTAREHVGEQQIVINGIPLVDEYGNPRMEQIYKQKLIQRVERRPIMEDYEETVETAPAYKKKNVRTHWGFSAQQVQLALAEVGLTANDFAGFVYDQETDSYGLRTDQFLPIMWAAMRSELDPH